MEKFLSGEFLNIVKKLLILVCIAMPPWIIFVKHIRKYFERASFNKYKNGIILGLFLLYFFLTYHLGEIPPFILVIIIFYFEYKNKNEEELYYLRPLKKKKKEVVLKSLAFKVVITIATLIFAIILKSFGIEPVAQNINKAFQNSNWIQVIYLSLLTVIVAPILEEFIFRHTLYRKLSKRIGKVSACIITSALFALLHFNFLGTVSFVGVAIYNCYLYDKYGYRGAVTNHLVFNLLSTIAMILYYKI